MTCVIWRLSWLPRIKVILSGYRTCITDKIVLGSVRYNILQKRLLPIDAQHFIGLYTTPGRHCFERSWNRTAKKITAQLANRGIKPRTAALTFTCFSRSGFVNFQ